MPITRFAPSSTGLLHIGHAFSALFARHAAGPGGTMLLRMEDIDGTRCREEFAEAIEEDLAWLGLDWPRPVRVQSRHLPEYAAALDRLDGQGVIYPCFCSRAELAQALDAPHGMGPVYPGTCRDLSVAEREERKEAGLAYALRLDVARASDLVGPLSWHDLDRGEIPAMPERLGDVVLARKDIRTSYHLSVVCDDAVQEIEIVTRGEDLLEATHIHRLLQALLGLPVPVWRHHRLLLDEAGRRFAKRDRAQTLRALRQSGVSAAEICARVGFLEQSTP